MTLSMSEYEMLSAMERRIQELEAQVALLHELVGQRVGLATPPVAGDRVDVVLVGYPQMMKINVIKVLRELTGLGLKETKDMSESIPAVVRADVDRDEGRTIERQLAEVQAKVDLRSR